jgi:ATP-dependent helicase HrpB
MTRAPLPIDAILADVVRALAETTSLVLEAPPGAGKTTRVPRALLESGAYPGEIVVLEPRRLAARMAARRVAEELGERVGETVGYQVRFEDVSGPRTRIRFVTEGVLTRRLLTDPALRGVSAVVLDEFHERHLHADVALALLHRLQRGARPDLRMVVMSATLEAAPIATFLGCATLRAEGRRFDVAIEHLKTPDDRPLASQVASAVRGVVNRETDGDVLVFLPGAAEIRRARDACEALAQQHDLLLLPLHGDLSPDEQDRAVRPASRRKVILATNVAESSVTIDGVVAVVDSGLARVPSHAPWSGLATLRVEKVSRASATQRAGRAGRTRAGLAVRLYTRADHDARPDHDAPEIRRLDLTQTVLELAAARSSDLAWFEAPPPDALRAAGELLVRLGATDAAGAVTPLGQRMLRFPLHPRQARLLVEAETRGVVEDGAVVAALIAERDIRSAGKARFDERGRGGGGGGGGAGAATERSDLIAMLDLFREAEDARFTHDAMRAIGLDAGATLAVDRARKQLSRLCARPRAAVKDPELALLACVLAGYPDRVARRKRAGSRELALAGGGIAELAEESVVRDAEWMVAVDAERRGPEARGAGTRVRIASGIEPDWLLDVTGAPVEETIDATWNASRERVDVVSRMTYDGLVIDESQGAHGHDDAIARVLGAAALAAGPRSFAPAGTLDRWLARARFVTSVGGAEAPGDDDVRAALVEACAGKRSFAELRAHSLLDVLKGRLGHAACARIDALAPERISLAAGRTAHVEYEEGKPPWAESYLQDFFGMTETPRIADGRAALVLHLWAPNKRAVQVTSDLAGFWQRHYPAIRKELARRYPRHSWPDDPTLVVGRYKRESR